MMTILTLTFILLAYSLSFKMTPYSLKLINAIRSYRGSAYEVGYRKYGGLLKYIQQKAWSQPTTTVRLT